MLLWSEYNVPSCFRIIKSPSVINFSLYSQEQLTILRTLALHRGNCIHLSAQDGKGEFLGFLLICVICLKINDHIPSGQNRGKSSL